MEYVFFYQGQSLTKLQMTSMTVTAPTRFDELFATGYCKNYKNRLWKHDEREREKKKYDENVQPVTSPRSQRLSAIINDCSYAILCESQVTRNPVGTWTTLVHLFSIYAVQRFSRTTSSSNEKSKRWTCRSFRGSSQCCRNLHNRFIIDFIIFI